MTDKEYLEWEKYHNAAFPSVGAWITARQETRIHWLEAIGTLTLESAKAATDAMLADVSGELERVFDATPQVIRRLAFGIEERKRRAQTVERMVGDDDELRYRCPICLDSRQVCILTDRERPDPGEVSIRYVAPAGIDYVRSWDEDGPPKGWVKVLNLASVAIPCSCANSDKAIARRKGERLKHVYNPERHCIVMSLDHVDIKAWVTNYDQQPARHRQGGLYE